MVPPNRSSRMVGCVRAPAAGRAVALALAVHAASLATAEETVTDETIEARTEAATAATRRYLDLRAAGQHADAYAMLAPSLAEELPAASFTARSSEFAARTGALRDVEIRGATWYDADPEDGRPDTLAVDLRAAYAEPVLVCGYLVWSMEGANPALRREELGVVEGAAIAGMTEAERDAAYARMGCR